MYSDATAFLIGLGVSGAIGLIVLFLLRALKKNINWFSLLGLSLCLCFAFITWQQINKKSAILGFSGERSVDRKKITRKKEERYYGKSRSTMMYYLCYQEAEEICVNVSGNVWLLAKVGDTMPVVRIKSDDDVYHTSGNYAAGGDLGFDKFLLIFELIGILIFALKIIFPKFLTFATFNKPENIKIFGN